ERAVVVAEVAGEEEMQLVADDWPAERDAVLLLLVIAHRDRNAVRVRADEVLILHVAEQRSVKVVRTGLGDGVDQAAHEAALAQRRIRDEGLRAGTGGREQWIRGRYGDCRQLDGGALEAQAELEALSQLEIERRGGLGLESQRARRQRVGAADAHVLERVAPI